MFFGGLFLILILLCLFITPGIVAAVFASLILQKVNTLHLRLIAAGVIAVSGIPLIFFYQFCYLLWRSGNEYASPNIPGVLGYYLFFSIAVLLPSIIFQYYRGNEHKFGDMLVCAAIVFGTGPILFNGYLNDPLNAFFYPRLSNVLLNPLSPVLPLLIDLLILFIAIAGFAAVFFYVLVEIRRRTPVKG